MSFDDLGLLFFTALALSLLLTPVSVSLARWVGAIDRPVSRSVHSHAIPRMGGLGMAVALFVVIPLFHELNQVLLGFLVGLVVITIVGIADDIWQLPSLVKLAGQIIAAVLFLKLSGLLYESFGDLFSFGEIVFPGFWAFSVSLFCFVGVINAMNLSDGLDGLSAGITAISCFFYGVLALNANIPDGLMLVVAIGGAVFGFLKFNTHPARLFMGDTGSLMLGFSLASVCIILGGNSFAGVIRPITVAIILGLPILDTLLVMFRRILAKKSPASPDNTHVHHRLLGIGISHEWSVAVIYTVMIMNGTVAVAVKDMPDYLQLIFGITPTMALYIILILCEKNNTSIRTLVAIPPQSEGILHNKLTILLGKSMKVLPIFILVGLSVPLLIASDIPRDITILTGALAILIGIAFPWRKHKNSMPIVYGIFYLCAFVILYTWKVSSYQNFNLDLYALWICFVLLVWSFLKIKFHQCREVLITSSFEVLIIFISWIIPYLILPIAVIPTKVVIATKFACLGAIPLLIAIKLVIKRQPHRNSTMAITFIFILFAVCLKSL